LLQADKSFGILCEQPKERAMPEPDFSLVRESFACDFEKGVLTWLARPAHHFNGEGWRKAQHERFAGRPARAHPIKSGHLIVKLRIQGRSYSLPVHRVVLGLHLGRWPEGDADHINGDSADNRLSNLREATRGQNARNSRRKLKGLKGAYRTRGGRWFSSYWCGQKLHHLGTFESEREAHEAWCRKNAEIAGSFFNSGASDCFS
jgi:hypothetical protein